MTRAVAVEYGIHGVRVNAVALGSVATERYAALLYELGPTAADRVQQEIRLLRPVGRIGRPDEVAATIGHLLSGEASFITGTPVPVPRPRSPRGRPIRPPLGGSPDLGTITAP